jgi:hypothetical protein
MARKDDILKSFLEHDILKEKYNVKKSDLPNSIREGLLSEIPIIKSIALIVDGLESSSPLTDAALRNSITQYLNGAQL